MGERWGAGYPECACWCRQISATHGAELQQNTLETVFGFLDQIQTVFSGNVESNQVKILNTLSSGRKRRRLSVPCVLMVTVVTTIEATQYLILGINLDIKNGNESDFKMMD